MPDSKSATASSGSSTSPSSAAPPISAPRSGPEARSQAIGGPACRNWPRSSPSTSEAGATSTSVACTSSIAASARSLASARSGSAATVARSASVPGIGGRQSTRVTSTAWAATASASRSAPTSTTAVGVFIRRLLRAARPRGGWRRRWTGGPRRRPRPARAWRSRPCGSCAVPTTATTTGCGTCGDRGREQRGRVGLGAVAEDDVEQHHAGAGSAAARARCSSRRVGSIIGWARPAV